MIVCVQYCKYVLTSTTAIKVCKRLAQAAMEICKARSFFIEKKIWYGILEGEAKHYEFYCCFEHCIYNSVLSPEKKLKKGDQSRSLELILACNTLYILQYTERITSSLFLQ